MLGKLKLQRTYNKGIIHSSAPFGNSSYKQLGPSPLSTMRCGMMLLLHLGLSTVCLMMISQGS